MFKKFGKPVRNLDCVIKENTSKYMPQEIYNASVKVIEKTGILGPHYITEKGYFLEGIAKDLPQEKAYFDIFYHQEKRTMKELNEDIQWQANLDPTKNNMIAAEMSEFTTKILTKYDPLAGLLPLGEYRQLPQIISMEISTPAGIQNVHFHVKDDLHIRLFKPKKEKYWFDFDVIKDYAFDQAIESVGTLKSIMYRGKKDYFEYYKTMTSNLDSIIKIYSFTGRLKFSFAKQKA